VGDKENASAVEPFRVAIEAAPSGMILVDRDGAMVLVNAEVERMFGYARAELFGRPVEMLVPERLRQEHGQIRALFLADPETRAMGASSDLFGLRKDGSEVPLEIALNPMTTAEGDFILVSVVDISDRKRAEEERDEILRQLQELRVGIAEHVRARTSELLASLKEREALLDAVQLRVKNNLQVIASLISLQIRAADRNAGRDALINCLTRVQAIALIHEKLYQSPDYARIPFSEYVDRLVRNIFEENGAPSASIAAQLSIENLALAVDQAIPCGLIINELVTNAIRHAFPGGRRGTIRVALAQLPRGNLELAVTDDGVGLPDQFDAGAAESLGLQLVSTLAQQLAAELRVEGKGGARFQLTFSAH
jgi:PAS domain S-box-containing protein